MPKTQTLLTSSLVIIAFAIGAGFGYSFTPQYQQKMSERGMEIGVADRLVDLRYMNAMIAHHRGAMLLAEQAAKSERDEIRSLSKAILSGEPKLIDELYTWKKEWYGDTRKVRDPKVARLGTPDKTFDLRFLNALISHHEAGIVMTEEIRLKSSRNQVLDNADTVESFLKTSGETLLSWRKEWYETE